MEPDQKSISNYKMQIIISLVLIVLSVVVSIIQIGGMLLMSEKGKTPSVNDWVILSVWIIMIPLQVWKWINYRKKLRACRKEASDS